MRRERNRPGKRKKPAPFEQRSLLVEGHVSVICETLVSLSTSSSHLCYQQPTTKNTELSMQKRLTHFNTWSRLHNHFHGIQE